MTSSIELKEYCTVCSTACVERKKRVYLVTDHDRVQKIVLLIYTAILVRLLARDWRRLILIYCCHKPKGECCS